MKGILKSIIVAILELEARIVLLKHKPKIVAITGSVGKTTTKDAIYAVLATTYTVRKSDKSFNTEIGIPLTVLGLPNAWNNPLRWLRNIFDGLLLILFPSKYPEWLVLEVGVDRPGDIARTTKWMKPNIVVLTRFPDLPVHVEYFDSPEAVVEEKSQLAYALVEDGVCVFNNDDERVRRTVEEGVRQRGVSYARFSEAEYQALGDAVTYERGMPDGMTFTVKRDALTVEVSISGALGVQQIYPSLAAIAVGGVLDIDLITAAKALGEHQTPPGRMRIIKGIKQSTIIDDSYNSSPVAVDRALETLRLMKTDGRKIIMLGDMLELGTYSTEEHRRIGKHVADIDADMLMTVGVRARGIAEGALENGMKAINILQYDEAGRAGRELQEKLEKGDVVLVKGSQGVRMERIVEEIMAEPEKRESLLVRQDNFWKDR